ncbi:MAG: DUF4342 domain-containing protein [Limnochordia bacterium]|nr:DUF4342 domain-containing protein [Limnochordia bacterium]MDD2629537.1 DUF4342 domain-containing protein [Limnochordia bacterium]MDD4519012.1 DUF4342 domain-containing protein [Limnochordia bacterium]
MGAQMSELEKIDILRQRGNIGYAEAKSLLISANGDIVEALINLEAMEKSKGLNPEMLEERGRQTLEKIKELLRRGNAEKIRVKKDNEVIMELPVTVGAIGAVLAPIATFVTGAACLLARCTIEIEQTGGKTITVNSSEAESTEGEDPQAVPGS